MQFENLGNEKAKVTLYQENEPVGETTIEEFNYMHMGFTEFKADRITAVNENDYHSPFEYPEEILSITFDLEAGNIDKLKQVEKDLHAD